MSIAIGVLNFSLPTERLSDGQLSTGKAESPTRLTLLWEHSAGALRWEAGGTAAPGSPSPGLERDRRSGSWTAPSLPALPTMAARPLNLLEAYREEEHDSEKEWLPGPKSHSPHRGLGLQPRQPRTP